MPSKTDMSGLSHKPAWLDQIVQVTATTNHENSPKSSVFEGCFWINCLWGKYTVPRFCSSSSGGLYGTLYITQPEK
jgi:hypothetical protein